MGVSHGKIAPLHLYQEVNHPAKGRLGFLLCCILLILHCGIQLKSPLLRDTESCSNTQHVSDFGEMERLLKKPANEH